MKYDAIRLELEQDGTTIAKQQTIVNWMQFFRDGNYRK
jgi:hypothetical protein